MVAVLHTRSAVRHTQLQMQSYSGFFLFTPTAYYHFLLESYLKKSVEKNGKKTLNRRSKCERRNEHFLFSQLLLLLPVNES